MNINIQEIVDNKIKSLNEDGTIKNAIEKTIENTVLTSITDALSDYSLKKSIQKIVETQVSGVVNDIGFTAYNSFIAQKIKEITEGVCRADIAEKLQKTFNDMLLMKRENIKLSEIFKAYREWICEQTETSEKYELENFHVKFEEDEQFGWFNIELAKEPKQRYSHCGDDFIKFTLHRKSREKNIGWISSMWIDDYDVKKKFKFGQLSEIEILLVNIIHNETPIIIDIENEDDIDSSFDEGY